MIRWEVLISISCCRYEIILLWIFGFTILDQEITKRMVG